MGHENILTVVLALPLAGALVVLFLRREAASAIKLVGIISSAVAFVLSVWLFVLYDETLPGMQFVEKYSWIPALDISYHIGIDGISLLLLVLTTFLTPIALLASWDSIQERLKGYVALMLLLEVGTLGVFMALDMFLFYVYDCGQSPDACCHHLAGLLCLHATGRDLHGKSAEAL
jgi:NADH-quinone oxidoreductase subunit M